MRNKIFKTMWGVALIVFFASMIFIVGILYQYFSSIQKNQLKIEVSLAAQGVTTGGLDYLEGLDKKNYRVTWIADNGKVLYDNQADPGSMDNHLDREEVRQAFKEGYGQAQRYSRTLAEKELYAAQKLPDNTVIRLSNVQMAFWAVLAGVAPGISFVILLALVLSYILASHLANKAIDPINQIDLDHPLDYCEKEEYREIEPLLRRIALQQNELKGDSDK